MSEISILTLKPFAEYLVINMPYEAELDEMIEEKIIKEIEKNKLVKID